MATADRSFHDCISAYHAERWRHARKCLKDVVKKGDEDSIHKARVEIKKLRALYEFAGSCDKDADCMKSIRPLRRMFKLMGRLRDHSNILSLCLEFKIDSSLFDKESKAMEDVWRKLKNKIEKHESEFRKIKKINDKALKHTSRDLWREYLHRKHQEIDRVLATAPSAEELHAIRKDIKHLLYNIRLCDEDVSDMIYGADTETLEKLQNLIGDWHDVTVLIARLEEMGYDRKHAPQMAVVKKKEKLLRKQIGH